MDFLNKYKNILGKPGQGVHALRFCGLAANDIIMTLAAAYIFAWLMKYSILYTFILFFIIGIFMHLLFGVKTPITTALRSQFK